MYIYIINLNIKYTVMAKNIGTLGKYDQRRLWKCICIVNPFDLSFKKNHKKSNLSLDNNNLKRGEILDTINGTLLFSTFLNLHLPD